MMTMTSTHKTRLRLRISTTTVPLHYTATMVLVVLEPASSARSFAAQRPANSISLASWDQLEQQQSDAIEEDRAPAAETASVDSSVDADHSAASSSSAAAALSSSSSSQQPAHHCNATIIMCATCRQQELRGVLGASTSGNNPRDAVFTRCQVRQHSDRSSCWLIAGKAVYDVTDAIATQPVGQDSILRKGGGVQDCAMDLSFHSPRGREMWKQYRIGRLIECGEDPLKSSSSLSSSLQHKLGTLLFWNR